VFGLLSDEHAHPATEFLANTLLTRFASTLDRLMDTCKGGVRPANRVLAGHGDNASRR
jgi:hypothetical protein